MLWILIVVGYLVGMNVLFSFDFVFVVVVIMDFEM